MALNTGSKTSNERWNYFVVVWEIRKKMQLYQAYRSVLKRHLIMIHIFYFHINIFEHKISFKLVLNLIQL